MPHMRLLLAAILAACTDGTATTATIDTLPGGIVRVVNHAPSDWADTAGWKIVLEAERRFAIDSAGAVARPNYPFRLRDGSVVVLDQGTNVVQRYDADLRPMLRFGRQGSGPGEFQNPGLRAVGDSIVVLEEARSSLVVVDAAGTFRYEARIPTFTDWIERPDAAGRLPLLGRYAPTSDVGVMWWSIPERRVVDSIIGPAGPEMRRWESCRFVLPYQPTIDLTPTRDGTAWWGISDADRFVETRTGRDTLRIIETPNRPRHPVDPAQLDELFAPNGFIAQQCGAEMRREDVPTTRPAWSSLHTDGEDNLWVSRPDGYDIYAPDGRWRGSVPRPFARGSYPYWNGDDVLTVDVTDEGTTVLRRYRVRRE